LIVRKVAPYSILKFNHFLIGSVAPVKYRPFDLLIALIPIKTWLLNYPHSDHFLAQ
jgi:hypothetical protein